MDRKLYISKCLRVLIPTVFASIVVYLLCYVLTDIGYSTDCFEYGPVGLPFYVESIVALIFVPMVVAFNQYDKVYGL